MITSVSGSIQLNHTKNQPDGAPTWRGLLHARGLSDAAIERAGLRPAGRGWLYPIAPDCQAQRWKAYPGQRGAKYAWKPSKPAHVRFYDPIGDLTAHVAAAAGTLILCEGEPDVWALWAAGVFNVTTTMHGAGSVPDWTAPELARLEVYTVQLWPDRDAAGVKYAHLVRAALAGTGIAVDARELPDHLGRGGDVGALLLDVGAAQLVTALEACPPLEAPTAPLVPPQSADRPGQPPSEAISDRYERWCLEVEAAAVTAWQIAPPNAKHLSRRNFSSPFRDDRRPSAQWSYTAHGFKDYATGEFHSAKEVAALLNFEPWETWRARNRPALSERENQIAGANASVNSLQIDAAAGGIHYPLGFPQTLTRTLLTAKSRTVDGEDLTGLAIIELAHTACQMPARVTIAEFARLAEAGGWPVDRRLVSGALARGHERGLYSFLPIAQVPQNNRLKSVQGCYEFKPLAERLHALGAWLAPRMKAPRRAPALAGEIAAVLGQPPEGLEALDAARADTLAAAQEARADHAGRAKRWLDYWSANVDRILAGSYQPLALEPQPLSAPRLRQALASRMIAEGVEVYRISAHTGLSRPKVLDLARAAGFESVPQTDTMPSDEVNEAVRVRGLVLEESDGQATIRRPNVLKPIDKLAEAERRAIGAQQARQRGLAQRRLERPENAQEARWRRQDVRNLQADERAAAQLAGLHGPEHRRPRRDRLDAWLDHQWALAPPLSPPPIDPETGEVYKGRVRWLAAFEIVRGGAMPTFSAHAEPKEREYGQAEPAQPGPDTKETRAGLSASAVGGAREQAHTRADHGRPAGAAGSLPGAHGAGPGAVSARESAGASERALSHGDRDARQPRIDADGQTDRNAARASMGASAGDHRPRAGGRVAGAGQSCAVCGAPATALHLLGWLCADHDALPLADKLALMRQPAPRVFRHADR